MNRHAWRALVAAWAGVVTGGASGQVYQRYLGEPPNIREHQHSIAYLRDDGVATAGFYFRVPDAGGPFAPEQFVTRHRDDGAKIWSFRYASNFETEFATSIREAGAGGGTATTFIVGGFSYPTTINVNVSMMRLDSAGGVLWAGNYFGGSQAPDPVSLPPEQWASVRGAPGFTPPTRGLAGQIPAGYALVTTFVPFQGGPVVGEFIRVNTAGALISMRLHGGPTIFEGSQVAYSDLRYDTATDTFVVAATLLRRVQPLPGGPLVDERYPMLVRLDPLGNFLTAFAFLIPSGQPGDPANARAWSIALDPQTGHAFLSGPSNAFGPGVSGAFVMRVTQAGVPVWAVAYKEFAPAVATLALDTKGRLSIYGTDRGAAVAPVPSLIVLDSATGANIFRRIYFPTGAYRGTDAVDLEGAREGWAMVGLADASPNPGAVEDVHILRTDALGKTGCFEVAVDPSDQVVEVEIVQLALQQTAEEIHFFRELQPVDPETPEMPICVGRCACPGDANGDGIVDFDDIVETLANWLALYAPGTGPGDSNCDGVVDFDDIVETLAQWLVVCP